MRKVEDIDIVFLWRVIKANWHWLILSALIFAASTYLTCKFLIAPVYEAEVSLFAWDEQHKKPLFTDSAGQPSTENNQGQSEAERLNDLKYGISINDITLGTQLVNDYKELIDSRYVLNKVKGILNERLPAEKDTNFSFKAMLPRQTRFMKLSVYSTSAVKAELAASVIAEVFIASVSELMNIKRVQVVDKSQVKGIVSPKTSLLTILAFIIGAGGLLVIFSAYHFFHYTLLNSEIVDAELKLPTIGRIGAMHENGNDKLACLPNDDPQRRFNHIVEDFLLLQTNLYYSLVQKETAQILLISSALPTDGKSFVSANMALTLADGGKRVLLVNCDLRKIGFEYFNIPRHPGLVNYLLGESKPEEIIHHNVLNSRLSVINNGPIPPNAARLLEIFQNSQLLPSLITDYDYIILDSPPLRNMADSLMLSKMVDGTIIVADSKRTPVSAVHHAIEQLNKLNVNILGVVLNKFSSENAGYGYGYGYGQQQASDKKS